VVLSLVDVVALRDRLLRTKDLREGKVSGRQVSDVDPDAALRLAALAQIDVLTDLAMAVLGPVEAAVLLSPTLDFIKDLADLEHGRVARSLLPPKTRTNGTGAREQGFRAMTAVVMQLLHLSGLSIDAAAQESARLLRSRGITASQVKKWRESAYADQKNPESILAARYFRLLKQIGDSDQVAAGKEAKRIALNISRQNPKSLPSFGVKTLGR
jgi:hypothetical protein